MSSDSNPYASAGGQYQANVSFGGQPAPVAAGDLIKDTTTRDFAADVIQESRNQVVLVDFWAPWCGPCKQLTPIIEKAVTAAGGKVKLVKMNIDDHPGIAGQLGIQSIPAVIAFRDGQPVDGFMGALPEAKVREFIDRVGGPGPAETAVAEAMEAAAAALEQGDHQTAADIYAQIVEAMPERLDAVAALGGLMLDAGEAEAARELLAGVAPEKAGDPALSGLVARMALAEQASAIGDKSDLLRRLDADPKDHQARFDLAMIQNAEGDRDDAADSLLAIMRADRTWQDDGARRQLLQFFEAWGMMDEATLAGRRKLSSLLFA